jgi:hypothetical protein
MGARLMLFEVGKHVDQGMTNRARASQRAAVPAIGKELACSKE